MFPPGGCGGGLLKSVWDRFFNRKLGSFFKDKPLEPKEMKKMQTPLFCSTIIAVAYKVAGYDKKFNGKYIYDVWPKDFVLDNSTQKVCRVDQSY